MHIYYFYIYSKFYHCIYTKVLQIWHHHHTFNFFILITINYLIIIFLFCFNIFFFENRLLQPWRRWLSMALHMHRLHDGSRHFAFDHRPPQSAVRQFHARFFARRPAINHTCQPGRQPAGTPASTYTRQPARTPACRPDKSP